MTTSPTDPASSSTAWLRDLPPTELAETFEVIRNKQAELARTEDEGRKTMLATLMRRMMQVVDDRPDASEALRKLPVPVLCLQPSTSPFLTLPKPYYVNPDGTIRRQDYWRGKPAALAGFLRRNDAQRIDLHREDWQNGDWQAAVGMYPVFFFDTGGRFNIQVAISTVTAHPELDIETETSS